MSFYVFLLAVLACLAAGEFPPYQISHHDHVGPLVIPVDRSDGHLADTYDVAAAGYAQYVAHANAAVRSRAYGHGYYGHCYGPERYGYAGLYSPSYDHGHGYGKHGVYRYLPINRGIYYRRYYDNGYGYHGHNARHHYCHRYDYHHH